MVCGHGLVYSAWERLRYFNEVSVDSGSVFRYSVTSMATGSTKKKRGRTKKTSLDLDSDLWRRLKSCAVERDTPIRVLLENFIRIGLAMRGF